MDESSVKVAVRVRPQNAKERIQMNQICTSVSEGEPQIFLGKDKPFTFDFMFDIPSKQEAIFNQVCKPLLDGCLEGYNATLFAYGQTGSGKTYTMGTGFELHVDTMEIGIIPRAVQYLFYCIEEKRRTATVANTPVPEFKVIAQFIELYNEELNDLLDTAGENSKKNIKIHENAQGSIYITGVSTRVVNGLEDTIKCLKDGALCRSTASTNMNSQSSRSHAIFTLHIRQQRVVPPEPHSSESGASSGVEGPPSTVAVPDASPEYETLTAKFHFVDLAGSERLKRTGATGDRAKEGIAINFGLLALGNVISALGDKNKRGCHVPYRDSKLTRLLQDSLGGNSRTIMIACVSPSDCDFVETLNTLQYANRARNIKNKLSINQDKTTKQLNVLRSQIQALQEELMEYKQGKRVAGTDGADCYSDLFTETNLLQEENTKLRTRVKALHSSLETFKGLNAKLNADKELISWRERRGEEVDEVDEVVRVTEKYTRQIEDLRGKLIEAEALATVLQRVSNNRYSAGSSSTPSRVAMGSIDFPEDTTSEFQPLSPILASGDRPHRKERRVRAPTEDGGLRGEETDTTEEDEANGGMKLSGDYESDDWGGSSEDIDGDTLITPAHSNPADITVTNENLQESIASLSSEIDVKRQLLEEINSKQKEMRLLKDRYERQVENLRTKIKETEMERDRVLASLGAVEHSSEERFKKTKEDFERQLREMQSQLRESTNRKREYEQRVREQTKMEARCRTLTAELDELRRLKVEMQKRVREEVKRTREVETCHSREVAQLRKEKRLADNQIRSLEMEKKQRELVIKRRQEEENVRRKQAARYGAPTRPQSASSRPTSVSSIRDVTTPTSRPRVGGLHQRRKSTIARVAKAKWDVLQRSISTSVTHQQKINMFERDLDTYITERHKCSAKVDQLNTRRAALVDQRKDTKEVEMELQNVRAQIEQLQESINDCQTNIIELEESKASATSTGITVPATVNGTSSSRPASSSAPSVILSRCNLEEAHYLLQHLYDSVLSQGVALKQREAEEAEVKAQLEARTQEYTQAMHLLEYALQQDNLPFDIEGLVRTSPEEDQEEEDDSYSDSAGLESTPFFERSGSTRGEEEFRKPNTTRAKVDRPEDLMGISTYSSRIPSTASTPLEPPLEHAWDPSSSTSASRVRSRLQIPKPAPDRMAMSMDESQLMPPPPGRNPTRSLHPPPLTAPIPSSDAPINMSRIPGIMTQSLIVNTKPAESVTDVSSPPSSPSSLRRSNSVRNTDANVFCRLTGTTGRTPASPTKGTIYPYAKSSTRTGVKAPLECTHIAEGHTKAVLDIDVSETLMITGSKDRTAKLWDLNTMCELATLGDHPNNVTKVRYSPSSHLIFTVCSYFIKLWDDRDSTKCIKTLLSNGLSQDEPPEVSQSLRQNICPAGQTNILDLVVNSTGDVLYTAAGNSVKMWDMRKFYSVGKLHGNHQAPIMVLAITDDYKTGASCVVTGSKDHYIKVFSVPANSVGLLTPSVELQPPHYDGIEALALSGGMLFSGSRDACIKKWDLSGSTYSSGDLTARSSNHQHQGAGRQEASLSNAHKDWIQGLCLTDDGLNLLSGCRAGVLKMWSVDDCVFLGEVQAHNAAVNGVRSIGDRVFTVSNDNMIKFWKIREQRDSTNGDA